MEGCYQSGPSLPVGWSKTGRRTRTTRAHHQMQPQLASDDDDGGHEYAILESDGFVTAIESLPPKKRKLELTTTTTTTKQHRCNICGRCFSSYQALGGHKAHHNTNNYHKPTPAEDVNGLGGGSSEHRCTFCYKVFRKGQALGGHRRHCQPPMAQNRQKIMFSFDLNQLPPDWLES